MENTYWYAVLKDNEDNDWGAGSYDLAEALELLRRDYPEDGRIAVIEMGPDPICVDVLGPDGLSLDR